MRILFIDIETTPHLAWLFDLRNVTVRADQIAEPSRILCFAAQWYGEEETEFWDYRDRDGMLLRLWMLLDEADIVIHFYGKRFDMRRIRSELFENEFLPFSPPRQIDLWETVKRQFLWPSSSLAYVTKIVGVFEKIKNEGMPLWTKCMSGDGGAWERMREYNIGDVKAMIPVYERLRPWITGHPNMGAFTGESVCPACGGADLAREGHATTSQGRFQRYRCRGCGKWSRDTHREAGTELAGVAE